MKKVVKSYWRSLITIAMGLTLVFAGLGLSFGGGATAPGEVYAAEDVSEGIASKQDAKQAGDKVNEEITAEGFILLKNENKALPLAADAKITVFGRNSISPVVGLGGSSGGAGGGRGVDAILTEAGFSVNTAMRTFYSGLTGTGEINGRPGNPGINTTNHGLATGETVISRYTDTVKNSFASFQDAAVVVFSRMGGEGFELPRTSYSGGSSTSGVSPGRESNTEHYLSLDKNERDLLKAIKNDWGFTRTVVLINSGNAMELGFLNDPDFGVSAAMIVGHTGGTGMNSLGKVLKGEVNPSGKTVDIFPKDFKKDPVWFNFGNNLSHAGSGSGIGYLTSTGGSASGNGIMYKEGIYMGYRYYETRAFTETAATWYDDNVVYPFGHGLSYTNFKWELVSSAAGGALTESQAINVDVKVTNEGTVAGKEVVQLYYSAPYKDGGIEKSHVVLGAFEKTGLLQPGASQTLRLTLTPKDMASWDMAAGNYVLEDGTYTLYAGKNSHAWADTAALKVTYTLGSKITFGKSSTGYDYKNQFQESTDYMNGKTVSRQNFAGTVPTAFPTAAERTVSASNWATALNVAFDSDANMRTNDAGKPWEVSTMPTLNAPNGIMLSDLYGIPASDPKWGQFLDQLTVAEMRAIVGSGGFACGKPINRLGVLAVECPDGPFGFTGHSGNNSNGSLSLSIGNATCQYASPTIVASTWNKSLAERQGLAIGNEGLMHGLTGIYAPGMNQHRSPFAGRNSEYYSEDGHLSGKIGAAVVRGMQRKGVIPFVKHFFLNDQETSRDAGGGLLTWANEQTLREVYLETWRLAVEEGGALGMMAAFNRVGRERCSSSYAILTEVLRNEWGFNGAVVTDWDGDANRNHMIRAGGDLVLNADSKPADVPGNTTHVAALRKASHHTMYAVANSNGAVNYRHPLKASVGVNNPEGADNYLDLKPRMTIMKQGFATLTWTGTGDLPQGLTYNATTGVISGKVAASELGKQFTFTTEVQYNGTRWGTNVFTITVVDSVIPDNQKTEEVEPPPPPPPANVPTAPQNFAANPGDGKVTLSWAAPSSDGGSPITKYEVSSDNGSTFTTASSSTGHTFTGLTNGTAYTFMVRAVNANGNGATATKSATPEKGGGCNGCGTVTDAGSFGGMMMGGGLLLASLGLLFFVTSAYGKKRPVKAN